MTVRVIGDAAPGSHQVTVRAGQWNVGLRGAPPPEAATAVPGNPALFAAELWFMTASSYQLAVAIDGPAGKGEVVIPVLALATAERPMPPWLGTVLAALGVFLTLGLLTIVGTAVRESGLPPGAEPDAVRRRRARISVALAGLVAAFVLWGGNRWWAAEAASYSRSVLYRPLNSVSAIARKDDRRVLTLSIRDERWTGSPIAESRYNALMPDHGKLMHLFMLREPALDALAHLHPLARSGAGLDFDTLVPALPAGRYRVYGDIVHESGYAQTLVSSVELAADAAASASATDDDDSSFRGAGLRESATVAYDFDDGSRLVWDRGQAPIASGVERELRFSLRDAAGGARSASNPTWEWRHISWSPVSTAPSSRICIHQEASRWQRCSGLPRPGQRTRTPATTCLSTVRSPSRMPSRAQAPIGCLCR